MGLLRRIFRHPRIARHYPARFRTTQSQSITELWTWIRDQLDPESRGFDADYGTTTSWFDLGNYEPTPPSIVEAILDALPGDPRAQTFIDLGCGKGRVVLLAAMRPFRRVVGVEKRRLLIRRARRNAAAFRGPLAVRPEWMRSDARDFRFPPGPLVVFLYNPFGPRIVLEVLTRLHGPAIVVLVNPPDLAPLEVLGFAVVERVDHPVDDRRWVILERSAQ